MPTAAAAPDQPEFSAVWPELSGRLARVLHSRRVPRDVVDDLVQETGLRLFRNWSKVDQSTVWALANTILLNLVRDEVRKDQVRKRDAALLVPERAASFDEEMLGRLELRRVEKVLRKLSQVDQQVLLAEWGEGPTIEFTSPAALKMARMRARQRLRAALEHASGLLPAWWRFRKVSSNPSVWNVSEQISQIAAAGVIVVVGVVSSIAAGDAARTDRPGFVSEASSSVRVASDPTAARIRNASGRAAARHRSDEVGRSSASRSGAIASDADEPLNENFGPIGRDDDGGVVVGEGGNGIGPYGADRTVETSPAGRKAKARVKAYQEAPKCDGELVIGGTVGESEPECEPGEGSAGVETEAEGQHHEAETP